MTLLTLTRTSTMLSAQVSVKRSPMCLWCLLGTQFWLSARAAPTLLANTQHTAVASTALRSSSPSCSLRLRSDCLLARAIHRRCVVCLKGVKRLPCCCGQLVLHVCRCTVLGTAPLCSMVANYGRSALINVCICRNQNTCLSLSETEQPPSQTPLTLPPGSLPAMLCLLNFF